MKQKIDFKPFLNALESKAFQSGNSRGRRYPAASDDDRVYAEVLDPFLLDREKIRQSKSFRRLADKTQVFISHQENSHVRNRKIHTDEVASLAVQIASILGLNVYLAEASSFGHDIGHSPFGHLGERIISELAEKPFRHEIMSVVIAQKIERSGLGLNLSFETLEGILYHSRGKNGLQINHNLPLEYAVVMLADKIAYTFSDLNDALRCGQFTESQLPKEFSALGKNQRERWLNCLFALVKESSEKGMISFQDSEIAQQFEAVRQWSYNSFYSQLDSGGQRQQAITDLKSIFNFLDGWFKQFGYDPLLIMALLTDQEAKNIAAFSNYPTIKDTEMLKHFSFMELLSRFPEGHKVDIFTADLNVEDFS